MLPNLFSFRGRVSRMTFWYIKITGLLISAAGHLAIGPFLPRGLPRSEQWHVLTSGPGLALLLLTVAVGWIFLANGVRRWHDHDKSGWWMLILLVPVLGAVWYLVECGFRTGTSGPNRYGPDPMAGQRDPWKRA